MTYLSIGLVQASRLMAIVPVVYFPLGSCVSSASVNSNLFTLRLHFFSVFGSKVLDRIFTFLTFSAIINGQ